MTTKERKKLKHSLKNNIDVCDTCVKLACIGVKAGVTEGSAYEQTANSREDLISSLTKLREIIATESNNYLKMVDETIAMMQDKK